MDSTSPAAVPPQRTSSNAIEILAWWAILILISGAITLIAIQWSYRHGRLCVTPFYDDVGYFNDGFLRLRDLDEDGIAGLLKNLAQNPPHSIFSSLLAMSAFAIFGIHDWAPYAASGIVVLGFLAAMEWISGPMPLSRRLAIIALAISSRFVWTGIVNFKPDFAWGVMIAVASVAALRQTLQRTSRRRALAIGICWGLAFLIKTSTFPVTLVMFAVVLAAGLIFDAAHVRRWISNSAWMIVGAAVIAGPYYIFAWHSAFDYFYANAVGGNRQLWQLHGSALFHARYYLDGDGGIFMLGWHVWLLLGLAAIGAIFAWVRSPQARRRVLSLLVVAVVAYLIPTLSKVKGMTLAAPFDAMLILLAGLGVNQILLAMSRPRWKWTPGLVIAAAAILIATLEMPLPQWERYSRAVAAYRISSDGVFDGVASRAGSDRRGIVVTTDGIVTGYGCLQYRAYRAGLPYDFFNLEPFADLPTAANKLRLANFVVASEAGNVDNTDFEPSTRAAASVLDWIRQSQEFEEIAAVPSFNGKRYFIFANRLCGFGGFDVISGLSRPHPMEPALRLPVICVAKGPATRLQIYAPQVVHQTLLLRVCNHAAGQALTIRLDGQELTTFALPVHAQLNGFDPFTCAVNLPAGSHELEIDYARHNDSADWRDCVAFSQLQLVPQK